MSTDLERTAYHEAGHVVAGWHLGMKPLGANIVPDASFNGSASLDHTQASDWETSLMVFAGAQAESIFSGCSFEACFAWDPHRGADDTALAIKYSKYRDRSEAVREARNIFKEPGNWWRVKAVAAALLEHKTLTGEQLQAVLEGRPIERAAAATSASLGSATGTSARASSWLIDASALPDVQAVLQGQRPARRRLWTVPSAVRRLGLAPGRRRAAYGSFSARTSSQSSRGTKGNGVALLSLLGLIEFGRGMFGDLGMGTDLSDFADQLDMAAAGPSIGTILIYADSPGGTSTGVPEVAQQVRDVAKAKRVISYSVFSASASYWLTSAAGESYLMPSGEVGSVGVFCMMLDISAALAREGIKPEIIRAPELKASTSGLEPLPDATRQSLQDSVNSLYGEFLGAVATHRRKQRAEVSANFGKGLTLGGREALRAGAVDGLLTLGELGPKLFGSSGNAGATGGRRTASAAVLRLRAAHERRKREAMIA